jgi:hypothetical protein
VNISPFEAVKMPLLHHLLISLQPADIGRIATIGLHLTELDEL